MDKREAWIMEGGLRTSQRMVAKGPRYSFQKTMKQKRTLRVMALCRGCYFIRAVNEKTRLCASCAARAALAVGGEVVVEEVIIGGSKMIPGIKAKHAIITPVCRSNRGTVGAFDEAMKRLREEYDACQNDANAKANFHLVLTVERPD